jgi:RNA polymerase sigma factor (sigma-70 family)
MAPFVTACEIDRTKVCERYQPLVLSIVKKLKIVPSSQDDAEQEGMVGLLEAYDHYDFTSPVRFGVFARPYVKGSIIRGVFPKSKEVRSTPRGDIFDLELIHNRHVVDLTDDVVEKMALRAWIDSLEPDDIWLIERRHWHGAASENIARELGRTVHWVNERHRILIRRAQVVLGAT